MDKIKDIYSVPIQASREVGIEIEMEGVHLLHASTHHWKHTEDGSLRGESAEYVLRKPIKRNSVGLVLAKLAKALKDNEAKLSPSERCGVHIHLNCQEMTLDEVFKFVILYLVFEDILVKFCGKDREGNLFCLRAKDAEGLIVALTRAAAEKSINYLQQTAFRYSSINLSALSKYGSIEFRSMRTPKDFGIIETWVKLLLKVKDAAERFKSSKDIIEIMSANGPKYLFDTVFGDMGEIISCPNMVFLIKEGVRRVQDLAYISSLIDRKKKLNVTEEPEIPQGRAIRQLRVENVERLVHERMMPRTALPFSDTVAVVDTNQIQQITPRVAAWTQLTYDNAAPQDDETTW